MRRTIVVPNLFALRAERFRLAQARTVGIAVYTFEYLAARLAGGFLEVATQLDIADALEDCADVSFGELDPIAEFPGFRRAASATLFKAWNAGLCLDALAAQASAGSPAALRYQAFTLLESHVLDVLPPSRKSPVEIAARALERIAYAPQILGMVEVCAHTELHPVWRPLLLALAKIMTVRWIAGPMHVPEWLSGSAVLVETSPAQNPQRYAEICADPRHEVVEAFRWARMLITERSVAPRDIAFAAASPQTWDEHVAAVRTVSDLPVHVAHGERAVRTPEGQAVSALAELLLNGVSRSRLLRFIRANPERRERDLAFFRSTFDDSPLLDWSHVRASLEAREASSDLARDAVQDDALVRFRLIVDTLAPGAMNAAEARALLPPQACTLWDRALLDGPAEALPVSIGALTAQPGDAASPEHAVLWCSAAVLASQPRRYVRLLGFTSRAWPRSSGDDPLLPAHIIEQRLLDSLPTNVADRRDCASIIAQSEQCVVFSRSRRNIDGRLNGVSPLWPTDVEGIRLKSLRAAPHAMSIFDRTLLRRTEFANDLLARSAQTTWTDWHRAELTSHDGLMPADHPILLRALDRVQSATSLQLLLRDPLTYLWQYGFRWRINDEAEEPFTLDARRFGELVHAILEYTQRLGGVTVLQKAVALVAADWETQHPLPPPVIWRATLVAAEAMAAAALSVDDSEDFTQTWSEVPFAVDEAIYGVTQPWDHKRAVEIGATGIRITGRIDRLELSVDGLRARVTDFKTGKAIPDSESCVNGGAELQRCLYAYAVRALLPNVEVIDSRLLYPAAQQRGEQAVFTLPDPEATLAAVARYLVDARRLFVAGATVPSVHEIDSDNFASRDEYFALPAGAARHYLARKEEAIRERLSPLADLWEMP